jgi:sortase A
MAAKLQRPLRVTAWAAAVLVIAWLWLMPQPKLAPIQPTHVVTTSTDHPSEEPITNYRSTATGAQPKYLRLPTIQAEGYIQAVGIDQHQQMAVPTNIHLAGWFKDYVIPGNPGLSIIDGHLDGVHKPGIFANLDKLKPRDVFKVELANGKVRQFRVVRVQSVPTAKAAAVLFSQIPGITRQLNLITCGGVFNTSARSYDHRVIVTSRLLE